MSNFIWHNPRCSKSRQTLDLLRDKGVEVDVVEYLQTPPAADAIAAAIQGLGIAPTALVRSKEALFAELGLTLDDTLDWPAILHEHPKLIERPVVCINGRYALGRPPENVLTVL